MELELRCGRADILGDVGLSEERDEQEEELGHEAAKPDFPGLR